MDRGEKLVKCLAINHCESNLATTTAYMLSAEPQENDSV